MEGTSTPADLEFGASGSCSFLLLNQPPRWPARTSALCKSFNQNLTENRDVEVSTLHLAPRPDALPRTSLCHQMAWKQSWIDTRANVFAATSSFRAANLLPGKLGMAGLTGNTLDQGLLVSAFVESTIQPPHQIVDIVSHRPTNWGRGRK